MPPSPGNAHTLATDIGEIRPGADLPRDRLRLLLKEFAALDDAREPWRVLYPLHEVLLLVTCATIASCAIPSLASASDLPTERWRSLTKRSA